MEVIFHNDQMLGDLRDLTVPIPMYALCHRQDNDTWWLWYHSWNNVTRDIESGARELPAVARTYQLLLGGIT